MKEAAEKHQSTHEMLVKNLCIDDCIPESLIQFMRKNAMKALEAVRKHKLAGEVLESENDELISKVIERMQNRVEEDDSREDGGWGKVEDENDHSQCCSKMGHGDHSKCVYVKWSSEC